MINSNKDEEELFEYFKQKKIIDKTPSIVVNGYRAIINSELDDKSIEFLIQNSDNFEIVLFDYYYKENLNDLNILNEFFLVKQDKWFKATKINQLANLRNVQHINLTFNDENSEKIFSELYKLNSVVSLNLGYFIKKYDISKIVDFKHTLKHLQYEQDAKKGSEKVISQLTNLTSITFVSSKFENFNFLEAINLEEFNLYGSRSLNFTGLDKIKSMKIFTLTNNPKIKNFDFILNFENLEELHLQYVKYNDFVPDLSSLKKLKIIKIY